MSWTTLAVLVATLFPPLQDPGPEPAAAAFAGTWEGKLDAGIMQLRIVLHLQDDGEGGFTGTMDSPDQGATGIPLSQVTAEDDGTLTVSVASIGGTWSGRLAAAGARLIGEWQQGAARLALDLDRVELPSRPARPQTPEPPFPYSVEEVRYTHDDAGVTLAGTLTLPAGDGPWPAALLISGSGAQDRDETLFSHKPFLVLADHLTRRGVAVLRVDDRGVGGSSAGPTGATSEDFAGDVLAGVRFLADRPEIDAARIGLIGHSEGGLIAPLAALREPDLLAFLVLLAPPGVPGEAILDLQAELLARAAGQDEEAIAANRALQERLFAILKETGLTDDERRSRLLDVLADAPADVLDSAAREEMMEAQVEQLMTPWFRFFLVHDPGPVLEPLEIPVLALIGAKDLQVPPEQNLPALRSAFRGHPDATVAELPGLNHLFQTAETGAIHEYGQIEETFAPAALERIADWMMERFGA